MKKLIIPLTILVLLVGALVGITSAQNIPNGPAFLWARTRVQQGAVAPTPSGTTIQKGEKPPQLWTEKQPTAYGMPALTLPVASAQIEAFAAQKGGLPGIHSLQTPTVTSVEYLTAGALRQQVGPGTLLDKYLDTAPVIYVQLAGQFTVDDPDAVQTHGAMIFDGTTGNLLTIHTQ